MVLRFSSATDVGRRRRVNQDSLLADPALHLFVVADGMGGHEGGEVAARLVVEHIHQFVADTEADEDKTWPVAFESSLSYAANRLKAAILLANQRLSDHVSKEAASRGMGATLAAALLNSNRVVVANIGDCRVYTLRDGVLQQITHDHSWVAEQVDSGLLTPESARVHPWRHYVTRAIQGEPDLRVDTIEFEIDANVRLLLCSDGLTVALTDEQITEILTASPSEVDGVCRALIEAANERGAPDNVSAIVVDCRAEDLPA